MYGLGGIKMSIEEKLAMYKANCEICTLAENMKSCPICKFYQTQKEKEIKENATIQEPKKS